MAFHMSLCIGSYLLYKMMDLQVITMGSFLTEIKVTEEDLLGIGEVLEPDGMGAETLMMSLVIRMAEVVEVINLATAGLEWEEAEAMTG